MHGSTLSQGWAFFIMHKRDPIQAWRRLLDLGHKLYIRQPQKAIFTVKPGAAYHQAVAKLVNVLLHIPEFFGPTVDNVLGT